MRNAAGLLALTLVAAGLAGCMSHHGHGRDPMGGGGHHGSTEGSEEGNLPFTGNESVILRVEAGQPEEFRFGTENLTAPPDTVVGVVFTNNGTIEHEFSLREFGFHLHASPGQTVNASFRTGAAGEYEFACHIPGHAEAGMKGVLRVA